jgi:SPP1 family predicted phage head-tail adaptor
MRADLKTQRVVIQTPTVTPDAILGRSESWGTLDTVWAQVKPTAVAEQLDGGQQVGTHTKWDVSFAYRTDVTAKMRVSWASKVLYILGMEPAGQMLREDLILRCEERV